MLTVDFFKGVTLDRDLKWQPVENSIEVDVAGRGLVRQWQAFVPAIRDGTKLPVTAEDAMHVVACIEAAFKASRERREVAVGWASVEMFGGVWGRWLTFRFRASIAAELTFRLTSQRRSNSCPTAERSSSSSSTRFDEADADRRR